MITIIGCGRVGCEVAAHYLQTGARVIGLVRRPSRATQLRRFGIEASCVDLDSSSLPALGVAKALFYFAPPPNTGTTDPRMRRLLSALTPWNHKRRIVYISTTGVYGDCQGAWVDETRMPAPLADRARRRLDAENSLREWSRATGGELIILRVAGIYGSGRLPVDRLRKGLPLVNAGEATYTNRIHAVDLVRVCISAMDRGPSGAIYNVSDGHPGTMLDYFNQVADLMGLARPPTVSLAEAERCLSSGMLSYMRESRRLDNRKLIEELGVSLRYPTLAEGLPACL